MAPTELDELLPISIPLPVGFVIVHYEDAEAVQVGSIVRDGYFPCGSLLEDRGKPECRARAFFALEADPASHELGQLLGNSQAQARPAVLACGGAIHLREGREEQGLLVPGDAYSRVADGETHEYVIICILNCFDGNDYLAMLGELDGVI